MIYFSPFIVGVEKTIQITFSLMRFEHPSLGDYLLSKRHTQDKIISPEIIKYRD